MITTRSLGEDIGSRVDRGTRLNAGMKNVKSWCKPPLSLLIKDAENSQVVIAAIEHQMNVTIQS
jgi:hypothetical protein